MTLVVGMFAGARMVTGRIPGVEYGPVTALPAKICDNRDNSGFAVGEKRDVVLTPIKIGTDDSVHAEVRRGFRKDDQVVVYGKEVLGAGRLVEPAGLVRKDAKGRSSQLVMPDNDGCQLNVLKS